MEITVTDVEKDEVGMRVQLEIDNDAGKVVVYPTPDSDSKWRVEAHYP